MLGISGWDWFTLGLYLVGITAIGVWTVRKIKDTADFFIGGRRFGKTFMVFFAFGSGTNGNQAVAVASKTFSNGMSGIWYQFLWLFATPFYWIIAPVFRRMRAVTTGDFFEHRFGGYTDALYAIIGPAQLIVNIGVMLKGSGVVIEAVSDHAISSNAAIVVMTVLFVVYGVAGGLTAAIVTDFIQGVLTIVLSFMLLPSALNAVGGFAGLHEKITDPNMFSIVSPGEITSLYVVVFALNALVGIVVQPHIMGVCAGGRDEMSGRVGFAAGNLLKRICTVAWMLTGLCAVALYANVSKTEGFNADHVYGMMARDLLPGICRGLVGVFIASLLASVMSSCDAFMVSSSGLFTQNLYRRYLVRGKDDRHYVQVGRLVSFVIVAASLAFAFSVDDVPTALRMFWKVSALMGVGFWIGLCWRRTTAVAVWASTLTAAAVLWATGSDLFQEWAVANLPERFLWNGAFREEYQMLSYLSVGLVTCIVVSLVTPRVPKAKLDRFYRCLRTPVAENEPHLAPFTLPDGADTPDPHKLLNHPDLEIPMPSKIGLAGFAGFWVIVLVMIWFVQWLATWGAPAAG